MDAAAENDMSPIHEEQLRDDVLKQAINPEQRELLRLLGVLDQAEAKVMRIAERAEATIEQHYKTLNHAATADAGDQHLLPVTLDQNHDDDILIGGYENWQDIDLQMTLDSGCCKHVLPADAAPGYEVSDSPSSRRGASFTVGNGAKVANEGQMSLNLEARLLAGWSDSWGAAGPRYAHKSKS